MIFICLLLDSLIFKERTGIDPPIPLGNFLGELTDEVPQGFQIKKVVVTGCKSYSYSMFNSETNEWRNVVKIKGISLNNEASKTISFNQMETMIFKFVHENDRIQERVRQRVFRPRSVFDQTMFVRKFEKLFQVTSEKRITRGFTSIPYGFCGE